MYLRFFLVFLSFLFTFDCFSTEVFVDKDQFLNKKPKFYEELYYFNSKQSQIIRDFKEKNPTHRRNIMMVSLYAFYDNSMKEIVIPRVFESAWLPDELSYSLKEVTGLNPFCLGNAYEKYNFFKSYYPILSTKRAPNDNFLSEAIYRKLKKELKSDFNYQETFINKLVDDFRVRGINFETRTEDSADFNYQNHAHTEQAFFSYIENSLENVFEMKELPKSILVNMVSYLPICNAGFCSKAIKTLLSNDNDSAFKSGFIKKIFPNAYLLTNEEDKTGVLWNKLLANTNINLLFTSSDLPSVKDFDVFNQNQMLFKAYN